MRVCVTCVFVCLCGVFVWCVCVYCCRGRCLLLLCCCVVVLCLCMHVRACVTWSPSLLSSYSCVAFVIVLLVLKVFWFGQTPTMTTVTTILHLYNLSHYFSLFLSVSTSFSRVYMNALSFSGASIFVSHGRICGITSSGVKYNAHEA